MENEFSNAILNWFLVRMAGSIGATEAFAFGNQGPGRDPFPLIAHIRPGNAPEETRRAAQKAFIELARPCIQNGKDGAIELRTAELEDRGQDPMFCLICLIHTGGPFAAPVAIIGFIALFPDLHAAKAALDRVRMVPPDERRD